MRIYTQYRTPRRGGGWSNWLYGLLTCAGLVFLGWMIYRTALGPAPIPAPTRPAPAHPTNALSLRPRPTTSSAPVLPPVPVPAPPLTNLPAPPPTTNPPPPPRPPPPAVTNPPPIAPVAGELAVPVTVLDTQLALTRLGYSPGSLDGVVGSQTRAALRTFQRENALPATGQADGATRAKLRFASPAVGRYEVAESDLSCLRPLSRSWLGKSQQERLDYETLLELVAEKFQTHPKLIRSLNPQVDWSRLEPGLGLNVPNTTPPAGGGPAATVRIRLAQRTLEARDDAGRLLAHFPCSIARLVEKRPMGTLRVVAIIRNPSYTFNPEIFPESEEGRRLGRKLHLPPGPNNPVGVAWIGLSRPGYGIHGTPRPEEVGRTESHGCFRLANWNAERLAQLVRVGTPVHVEP